MSAQRCEAISRAGNPCRRYALPELDRGVCRLHATPEEREMLREIHDVERRRLVARCFLEGEGRASALMERFAAALVVGAWNRAEQWASEAFMERDEAMRLLMEDANA
jgi:hypothetical protein